MEDMRNRARLRGIGFIQLLKDLSRCVEEEFDCSVQFWAYRIMLFLDPTCPTLLDNHIQKLIWGPKPQWAYQFPKIRAKYRDQLSWISDIES